MTPDASASVVNGLERLEPWLDDGNIIIAVEGKHFRIHRSVLCLYSEVFKDRLSVPRVHDTEGDLIDGCLIIQLHDAVADVEIILKALYDRSYVFFQEIPMPISVLEAFLRMGKKYVIRQLFEEAKRRISFDILSLEQASTISSGGTLFPGIAGSDPFNFMIMNAANEAGLLSTTIAAAIYCCLSCPALSIVDGYDFNGARCTLSTASKRYCFLVQRYLVEADRQLFDSLSHPAPTCSYRMSSKNPCNGGILAALRTVQYPKRLFTAWVDSWDHILCAICTPYLRDKHTEARTEKWNNLPISLGLEGWESIDKDAESYSSRVGAN